MGGAASRAEDDTGTLEELRHHWGDAYHIRFAFGAWNARRRDGRGGTLTDPSGEGLNLAIRADYTAAPVPRDTP